jgi:hypothetical protein
MSVNHSQMWDKTIRLLHQLGRIKDWLIIYGFTSRSRIFNLYGDIAITGEGVQNSGLWSALSLLWHGASVFPVSSEVPPHSVASYDTQGDVKDLYLNPNLHGSPFSRFLRHARGCWGSAIFYRIHTGLDQRKQQRDSRSEKEVSSSKDVRRTTRLDPG